jgi:colicin import membrane protein
MADEKISSQINLDLTANAAPALSEIAKVTKALEALQRQQDQTTRQRNVATAAKSNIDAIIKAEGIAAQREADLRARGLEKGADRIVSDTTRRIADAAKVLKTQLAEVTRETVLPGGRTRTESVGGLPNAVREAAQLRDIDIDAATKNIEAFKALSERAGKVLAGFDKVTGPRADAIDALSGLQKTLTRKPSTGWAEDSSSGSASDGVGRKSTSAPVRGIDKGEVQPWDPSRFTPEYIAKLARLRSEGLPEKAREGTKSRSDIEAEFTARAKSALEPLDLTKGVNAEAIKARAGAMESLLSEEKVLLKRQADAQVKQVSEVGKSTESEERIARDARAASDARKKAAEAAKAEEKATSETVQPAQENAASAKKIKTAKDRTAESAKAEEKAVAETVQPAQEAAASTKKTKSSKAKTAESAKAEEKASEEVASSAAVSAEATKKTRTSRKRSADASKVEAATEEASADQRTEAATKSAKTQKATEAKAAEAAKAEQQAIDALQKRVRTATTAAATKPRSTLFGEGTGVVRGPTFLRPYGPTRTELGAETAAPKSLNDVASAANRAASGLNSVATAAGPGKFHGPGRVELGASVVPTGLTPTRTKGGSLMSALTAELKTPELAKASANVHKLFRQVEAANNPKYVQGFTQISQSIFSVGGASNRAGEAIRRMSDSNSGFLGQIKGVLGMAASYQVLQGIAAEVGQLIGHLSGGIIKFNSMIERTTVGFTTLFKNQARASVELAEETGKVNTEMADLSGELDYIKLGYTSVEDAAGGMIENIRQFANVTPFRFEELAEATLRMRAFGFSLDEVLRRTEGTATGFSGAVQTVGDAVAALGGGAVEFKRITYALGQMKQAGRVYQNDMMQLANAGIGGYKYIADALMDQISTTSDDGRRIAKKGYEGMYKELQTNAIETIRRLTTSGRISGEVASRAILQGMEKDFGGGMAAYAKTFYGALTTVADSSQSLVAQAFKPLYDSIRDTTIELAAALQTSEAVDFARGFAKYVAIAVEELTKLGKTVFRLVGLIGGDLVGAIRAMGTSTRSMGGVTGSVFTLFQDGLGVIVSLLENDVVRSMIIATAAMKLFTSAAVANPLIGLILTVIVALGALQNAYDQNLLGFRQQIDSTAKKWGPMIQVIQDKVIPLLNRVGEVVTTVILASFITLFQLLEPTLQGVVDIVGSLINQFEFFGPIIGALGSGLVLALGGTIIISAISRLRNALGGVAFSLSQIGLEAAAAKGMLDKMTISAMQANSGVLPPGQKPGFVPVGGSGGFKLMGAAMVGQMALGAVTPGLTDNGNNQTMTAITGVTNSVLSLTMAAGLLKTLLPTGLGGMLAAGISSLLTSLPIVGAKMAAVASAAQLIQLAMVAWPVAAAIAVAGIGIALNDFLNSQQAKEFKNYMDEWAALVDEYNIRSPQGEDVEVPTFTDEESLIANDIRKKTAWGKDPFEGQGLLGTEFLSKSKDEFGNIKKEWQDVYEKLLLIKKAQDGMVGWKLRTGDWVTSTEKVENNTQSIYDLTGLLIEGNQKIIDGQERLNFLLDLAKLKYKGALDLLQELANSILNKILNPDVRINPYTGLEQVGLELQEVLSIQQEMSFAQFENASGTVRSFDEYRSILESILPLSERDYELKEDGTRSDKISLKAVNERLKIEKERRKELDLIRKAAEAEYDLSIEVLKQYDQSIDPLERAVSLRNAQLKYQKDIADLEFQSLENVVDQAKVSKAWERATAITKIKLRELQKGQELILNEMKRMFEEYEQDIANIMADPRLSEAQKKNAATERLKKLMSDLEAQFGITEVMLTNEIKYFNKQIDDYIATLGMQGKTLNVSWGGKWAAALEAGGFGVIKKYLNDTLKEIIRLMALITSATDAQSATEGDITLKNRAAYLAIFREKLSYLASRGLRQDAYLALARDINIAFAKEMNPARLLELRNKISATITGYERTANLPNPGAASPNFFKASGGMISGGNPYVVGEKGPELIIPKSQGLVLNNSVSSRLMSMMTGRGSGGGNNVIINVNNPTIRSDNDIRKLADRITRAQVSAFRTSGGRLS